MPDNGFSPQKSVRLRIALTLHVLDWSLPSNNFELQTCDQDLALYFYIASAHNWVFPRELNCFKLYNLELRWRGLRFIWHNFVSFLRLQFWHREHTQIWHSLISPPLCICEHRLAHMALQKIKSFTNVQVYMAPQKIEKFHKWSSISHMVLQKIKCFTNVLVTFMFFAPPSFGQQLIYAGRTHCFPFATQTRHELVYKCIIYIVCLWKCKTEIRVWRRKHERKI